MSLRPNEALPTAAPGGRSLAAVLAAGRQEWKRVQSEREEARAKRAEARKRAWMPMHLAMRPPLHPEAATWDQEMLLMILNGGPPDVLLRAEMTVDRDIVHTFNKAGLASAEIVVEREVKDYELWNMQVQVWNDLAKLYRDMAATIDELFSQFNGNDNPDIKRQQDVIDKYVSHKHYYTAMRLAVNRLFSIVNDSPPEHYGYKFDHNHENDQQIKNLALRTFKERWVVKAGEAALLEAVRSHLATLDAARV